MSHKEGSSLLGECACAEANNNSGPVKGALGGGGDGGAAPTPPRPVRAALSKPVFNPERQRHYDPPRNVPVGTNSVLDEIGPATAMWKPAVVRTMGVVLPAELLLAVCSVARAAVLHGQVACWGALPML